MCSTKVRQRGRGGVQGGGSKRVEYEKSDEKKRNYGCASEHYECSYIGVGVT